MAYPEKPNKKYSLKDYDFAQEDKKIMPMDEFLFKNGYLNADESEQRSVPDAHNQNWLFDLLHRNLRYTMGVAEENMDLLKNKTASPTQLGQIKVGKGLNISNGILSVVSGIADKANIVSYDLPIGSYMLWAGTEETVPDFFIEPKGQTLLRDNYQDLWNFAQNNNLVGTLFGEGDGTTTFTVTDLRDTFISIASQNNVGTFTPDGLPNITGLMGNVDSSSTASSGCFERKQDETSGSMQNIIGVGNKQPNVYFDASKSNNIYGNSDKVTPANWSLRLILKAKKTPSTNQVPIGTILDYTGSQNSIPDGYIVADGKELKVNEYQDLYNWAKNQGLMKPYSNIPDTPHGYYGENNNSTKFKIPDLRGVFKRNIDSPSLNDNTKGERGGEISVGKYQPDGLPNIEGVFDGGRTDVSPHAGGAFQRIKTGEASRDGGSHWSGSRYKFNAHNSNDIYGTSNYVQPKSVTIIPILKY